VSVRAGWRVSNARWGGGVSDLKAITARVNRLDITWAVAEWVLTMGEN
jgi:hypothetical protein